MWSWTWHWIPLDYLSFLIWEMHDLYWLLQLFSVNTVVLSYCRLTLSFYRWGNWGTEKPGDIPNVYRKLMEYDWLMASFRSRRRYHLTSVCVFVLSASRCMKKTKWKFRKGKFLSSSLQYNEKRFWCILIEYLKWCKHISIQDVWPNNFYCGLFIY